MVMVTVEILEIEVLFCTYVWGDLIYTNGRKGYKKTCSIQEQAFFLYACIRDYSPQFIASIRL